jgi:hypothetical protein
MEQSKLVLWRNKLEMTHFRFVLPRFRLALLHCKLEMIQNELENGTKQTCFVTKQA